MRQTAFIEWHTQKLPPGDRLTPEEAQRAWIRDVNPQNKDTDKDIRVICFCFTKQQLLYTHLVLSLTRFHMIGVGPEV